MGAHVLRALGQQHGGLIAHHHTHQNSSLSGFAVHKFALAQNFWLPIGRLCKTLLQSLCGQSVAWHSREVAVYPVDRDLEWVEIGRISHCRQ